jgi:hypothetical protein
MAVTAPISLKLRLGETIGHFSKEILSQQRKNVKQVKGEGLLSTPWLDIREAEV